MYGNYYHYSTEYYSQKYTNQLYISLHTGILQYYAEYQRTFQGLSFEENGYYINNPSVPNVIPSHSEKCKMLNDGYDMAHHSRHLILHQRVDPRKSRVDFIT